MWCSFCIPLWLCDDMQRGNWGRTVVSHLCSAKVAVWFTSAVFNAGILLGTESGRKSWGEKIFSRVFEKIQQVWKDPGTLTGLHISAVLRKERTWTNTSFLKADYSMLWTEVMAVGNLNSAGALLPAGKILTELDIESTSGGWGKETRLCITPKLFWRQTTAKGFALNYPFLQPVIILKWLRTGAGLFY